MSSTAEPGARPASAALAALRAFLTARGLLVVSVALGMLLVQHVSSRGGGPGVTGEAFPAAPLLSAWLRWDSYEWVARIAGSSAPLRTEAVISGPLLPLLARPFAAVVGAPAAALVVAAIASMGTAAALGALACRGPAPVDPKAAAWLLACFPTSYLLSVPNSASLLVSCAVIAFLADTLATPRARSLVGGTAVLLGAFAHPAGALLLTIPFALDAVLRRVPAHAFPWFTLAALPAVVAGNVLDGARLRALGDPLLRIGPSVEAAPEVVPGAVAWLVAAGAGGVLLLRRRHAEGLYTLACLSLPWLSLASVGRAAALAFPALLLLAGSAARARLLLPAFAPLLFLASLLHVLGLSSD